jgi:hypothetical protein
VPATPVYVAFAAATIAVLETLDTLNDNVLVGFVPPKLVPAIETVFPIPYPLPPSLRIIDVEIGCPVAKPS